MFSIVVTAIVTVLVSLLSVVVYLVRRNIKANINGKNKYVLVTGAAGGIGKEICTQLMKRHGVFVFACDMNEKALHDHYSSFEEQGIAMCIKMDVTKKEEVEETAQKVGKYIAENHVSQKREGRLFGLVNNAGIGLLYPLCSLVEKTDEQEMLQLFNINYFGLARTTTAFYPLLTKERQENSNSGCIVNIASIVGRFGHPFWSHYCATKHAVVGYTDTLRREFSYLDTKSKDYVRIICVDPGITNTPIIKLLEPSKDTKFTSIIKQVKVAAEDPAIQFNNPAYIGERIAACVLAENSPANIQIEHLWIMRFLWTIAAFGPLWLADIAVDLCILRTPETFRRSNFLKIFWHH